MYTGAEVVIRFEPWYLSKFVRFKHRPLNKVIRIEPGGHLNNFKTFEHGCKSKVIRFKRKHLIK